MRAVWVAGLVLMLGCSSAVPVPARKPPVVAPAASAAPAAPDERDRLWALAPESATLGVVVSPRGVAAIERTVTIAQDLLTSSADFAAAQAEAMRLLIRTLGTPSPTLAGFGLSHDRGFALFVVDDGQLVMVLPVGDRERFVAALQGSRGADGDVVGTWACQMIDGRYVCAQRRALFASLGCGGLDAVRRSAAARGGIEIAGRGMIEPLGRSFAAVAELDRGTVVLRGTVDGVASAVTDLLGAPGRPRADAAGAAGFGVADPRRYRAAGLDHARHCRHRTRGGNLELSAARRRSWTTAQTAHRAPPPCSERPSCHEPRDDNKPGARVAGIHRRSSCGVQVRQERDRGV